MKKVPDNVLNPVLYKRAYEKSRAIYGDQTSAYRSMAIVTEYKKMGGAYRTKTHDRKKGVVRWLKERWIMVTPYLRNRQIIPCGARERREHACRPLVRVDLNKTPITIDEVVHKHGKQKVKALADTKKRYGSERVLIDWNQGTIKKSLKIK
jgi:hypothetical protein